MGFQQYVLLVLAALIIATAIFLGIEKFSQDARVANEEAVIHDAFDIASKAQSWLQRHAKAGGGGRSFDGLTLEKLGVRPKNADGDFSLDVLADDKVKVTGRGLEGELIEVMVTPNSIQLASFLLNGPRSSGEAIAAESPGLIQEARVGTASTDELTALAAESDSVDVAASRLSSRDGQEHSAPKKRSGLLSGCAGDRRR